MSTITGQLQLPQLSPRYLNRFAVATHQVPVDCREPIWIKQPHGTEMAFFALKQTVDFYCNQDTPVYMCFLDAKKAFDRVNHWTLAKKLLTEMCHCILWNCLSFGIESKGLWYDGVTHYQWHSVAQMRSGKGDSCHHCSIMYIQMTWTITWKQQVLGAMWEVPG